MAPYRKAPQRDAASGTADAGDSVVLAVLLLVIGGLRLVIAIVNREVFGAEATIALLMVVLGVVIRVRGQ